MCALVNLTVAVNVIEQCRIGDFVRIGQNEGRLLQRLLEVRAHTSHVEVLVEFGDALHAARVRCSARIF